jgi:hypothetical protein
MAKSPPHQFGQIIGNLLEAAFYQPLKDVADEFGLYLDYKHKRPARRNLKKVSWTDYKGNNHDLDYVLEEGGSEQLKGRPRAFIETAWRSYTKHSRNKAQEMQGAIQPLIDTHKDCHPFVGVVLAGRYTRGSINQLNSHDFRTIVYYYDTIVKIFMSVGIDASWDEDTDDAEILKKVEAYKALGTTEKERLIAAFRDYQQDDLRNFLQGIKAVLGRAVECVFILPLHGDSHQLMSVSDAIKFLENYSEDESSPKFVRYELNVRYTNANEIRGQFNSKAEAIQFLRKLT